MSGADGLLGPSGHPAVRAGVARRRPQAPAGAPGAAQSVGLWVFCGVVTTLFSLFLAAYVMRLSEPDATSIGMPWQLGLSSVVLVAAGLAMQRAARLAGDGDGAAARRWLLAAGAGALLFIGAQWWAWQAMVGLKVSLQGNPAGSFFYVLTALHALHVVGGLVGWVVAWHGEAAALEWRSALLARYWHLLLAVWLALYAAFAFITPEIAGLICGTR